MGVDDKQNGDALIAAIQDMVRSQRGASGNAALYLVATPIGNLADITLRALNILASVDVVYCEDTRHSRILCERFCITTPLKSYHEHNAEKRRPEILKALQEGRTVALISDAGTPLISDPGYKLVRDVAAQGGDVISVPGPSAALAALTASGLETNSFLFAGFLPSKTMARQAKIQSLAAVDATLIFYEAPQRVGGLLSDLIEKLGDRPASVARELTKLHEEVRRGTLTQLQGGLTERPIKGECVVLVGPPNAQDLNDDDLRGLLQERLKTESLKDAARMIAEEFGVSKSHVYDLGVQIKRHTP